MSRVAAATGKTNKQLKFQFFISKYLNVKAGELNDYFLRDASYMSSSFREATQ
jgi:hypothetical protein